MGKERGKREREKRSRYTVDEKIYAEFDVQEGI